MTERKHIVHVIGIDASGPEKLSTYLQELIISAQRIAAPTRVLEILQQWWEKNKFESPLPELIASEKTSNLIKQLKSSNKKTVLLASGDPLWFGIGRILIENIPSEKLCFHPSPTSLQIAFSRLGRPWQDASWISLHGRDPFHLAKLLQERPAAIGVLTDPNKGGAIEVQQFLRSSGLEEAYAFWIFECLGHPNERIHRVVPGEEISNNLHPLNLVILVRESEPQIDQQRLPLFGIEDGLFKQYSDRPGLMTKRETRIQLLADLDLPKKGVLWDMCAGVGSIGLEALRIRPELKLLAVDKRIGCKDLIQSNAQRLSVKPTAIYELDVLTLFKKKTLPSSLMHPDRVLLGGGGYNRLEILSKILEFLNPNGIVVIPLSNVQALNELENLLRSKNYLSKISQIQTYRGVPLGDGTRLSPMNPVFILKGKKK